MAEQCTCSTSSNRLSCYSNQRIGFCRKGKARTFIPSFVVSVSLLKELTPSRRTMTNPVFFAYHPFYVHQSRGTLQAESDSLVPVIWRGRLSRWVAFKMVRFCRLSSWLWSIRCRLSVDFSLADFRHWTYLKTGQRRRDSVLVGYGGCSRYLQLVVFFQDGSDQVLPEPPPRARAPPGPDQEMGRVHLGKVSTP